MNTTLPNFRHVAILGVGLLGGSIGLALRRSGFVGRITGFGHRQSSLDVACQAGAIDEGFLELAPALAGADLVILGSPIGLFQRLLAESAPLLAPGAVVTDVGSTKRQVVRWAGKLLPPGVHFVGTHPIAGSDKRGVQYARADLFDGACCVITPGGRSRQPSAVSRQLTANGSRLMASSVRTPLPLGEGAPSGAGEGARRNPLSSIPQSALRTPQSVITSAFSPTSPRAWPTSPPSR